MNEKYFCRSCLQETNHTELYSKNINSNNQDAWSDDFYAIIECKGCETISFLKIYVDSNIAYHDDDGHLFHFRDRDIYPFSLRPPFKAVNNYHLLPYSVKRIYEETIQSIISKSYLLSSIGLRMIIEAAYKHLESKKKAENLVDKIDNLTLLGHLTSKDAKGLHAIRFIGNDAAHELTNPEENELSIALEIINNLLYSLFLNEISLSKLETLINDYEVFIIHLRKVITLEMVGNLYTLSELLGKTKRLFRKKDLTHFQERLISDIKNNKVSFLALRDKKYLIKNKPPYPSVYQLMAEKHFPNQLEKYGRK